MVLVAVFENRRGPDELAAKLGHVLDLNGRRNGLERQLVGILAETIQVVSGK
jgi:plasmid stability protein